MIQRIFRRIRPTSDQTAQQVKTTTLLGWYMRKGFAPAIRGALQRWRFNRAGRTLFLGSHTRISYARFVSFGEACYLGDNTRMLAFSRDGVHIGNRVTIRENGWIQCSSSPANPGEGLWIGDGTYIGPGVVIGVGGAIRIGQNVQLGSGVTIIAENHESGPEGPSATEVTRKGVQLGDRVWLGHRATVLDGVTLGDGCIVGAGAVVTKSFPPGTTVVGVPARAVEK